MSNAEYKPLVELGVDSHNSPEMVEHNFSPDDFDAVNAPSYMGIQESQPLRVIEQHFRASIGKNNMNDPISPQLRNAIKDLSEKDQTFLDVMMEGNEIKRDDVKVVEMKEKLENLATNDLVAEKELEQTKVAIPTYDPTANPMESRNVKDYIQDMPESDVYDTGPKP